MLTAFYVDPHQCDARVIKFVDRIWLDERGNAEVLRKFIIEAKGTSSLNCVYFAACGFSVSELKDLSARGLDDSYYFNFKGTGGAFSVTKKPASDSDFGLINTDGIDNVLVFPKVEGPGALTVRQLNGTSIAMYQFRRPIVPKEKIQVIVRFRVASLAKNLAALPGQPATLLVDIPYLMVPRKDSGLEFWGDHKIIPVAPFVEFRQSGTDNKFVGGFDIFLYLPFAFIPQAATFRPASCVSQQDSVGIDGIPTKEELTKIRWRLRSMLQKPSTNPYSLPDVSPGTEETLTSRFEALPTIQAYVTSPDPTPQLLESVRSQVVDAATTFVDAMREVRSVLSITGNQLEDTSKVTHAVAQRINQVSTMSEDLINKVNDIVIMVGASTRLARSAMVVTILGMVVAILSLAYMFFRK